MKETEEYTPTEEIVVNFLRAVAERKNEVDLGNKLLHKRYHGWKNPGCCLVKKKTEPSGKGTVDIFTCVQHPHVECLRSGWEIGWYGGTNSREL
jgi:hypothetical protein